MNKRLKEYMREYLKNNFTFKEAGVANPSQLAQQADELKQLAIEIDRTKDPNTYFKIKQLLGEINRNVR